MHQVSGVGIAPVVDGLLEDLLRVHKLVYSQLSAYVHGSAWSLRRQLAHSHKHYDERIVLADIATMVRTTLIVWVEWARFSESVLGWKFSGLMSMVATRLEALDSITFPRADGGSQQRVAEVISET